MEFQKTVTVESEQFTNSLDIFKPDFEQISLTDIIVSCDQMLKINGMDIIVRKEDGYVNLTKMCQAGGKEMSGWLRNKSNQDFLNALSTNLQINILDLIRVNQGGNGERHTWGHPQVAIKVAQWLSPEIDVQISRWIFELIITGSVQLGNEKSNEQLEKIYHEKLQLEEKVTVIESKNLLLEEKVTVIESEKKAVENSYKKLHKNHERILKRRNYHMFKLGMCFYIVYDCDKKLWILKIGCSDNINKTLQTYRRNSPNTKLLFLAYCEHAYQLEQILLKKYSDRLTHANHETIINVETQDITDTFKVMVNAANFSVTYEEDLEKYNSQITDETVDEDIEETVDETVDEDIDEDIDEDVTESDDEEEQTIKFQRIRSDIYTFSLKQLQAVEKDLTHRVPETNKPSTIARILRAMDELSSGVRYCDQCHEGKILMRDYHPTQQGFLGFFRTCYTCEIQDPKFKITVNQEKINEENIKADHKICHECKYMIHNSQYEKRRTRSLTTCKSCINTIRIGQKLSNKMYKQKQSYSRET